MSLRLLNSISVMIFNKAPVEKRVIKDDFWENSEKLQKDKKETEKRTTNRYRRSFLGRGASAESPPLASRCCVCQPLTLHSRTIDNRNETNSWRFSSFFTGGYIHPRCNHLRNDESCKFFIPNARVNPVNKIIPVTSELYVASKQQIRIVEVTITLGKIFHLGKRGENKNLPNRGEGKKEGTTGVSVKFLQTKFSH